MLKKCEGFLEQLRNLITWVPVLSHCYEFIYKTIYTNCNLKGLRNYQKKCLKGKHRKKVICLKVYQH